MRGKGLMIGVEMVSDRKSRKPLSLDIMLVMMEIMKDMGVLIGKGGLHGNVFRIKPPMCITKEDVDFSVAVFDKTVETIKDMKM